MDKVLEEDIALVDEGSQVPPRREVKGVQRVVGFRDLTWSQRSVKTQIALLGEAPLDGGDKVLVQGGGVGRCVDAH